MLRLRKESSLKVGGSCASVSDVSGEDSAFSPPRHFRSGRSPHSCERGLAERIMRNVLFELLLEGL